MEATMIKIKLTTEDVSSGRYSINIGKGAVEECVARHWRPILLERAANDDIKVVVKDLDTNSEHEVNFRYYKQVDSYFLQGLWRINFIDRRLLVGGDEIGIGCDSDNKLCFRLLKRA